MNDMAIEEKNQERKKQFNLKLKVNKLRRNFHLCHYITHTTHTI